MKTKLVGLRMSLSAGTNFEVVKVASEQVNNNKGEQSDSVCENSVNVEPLELKSEQ